MKELPAFLPATFQQNWEDAFYFLVGSHDEIWGWEEFLSEGEEVINELLECSFWGDSEVF